VANVRFIPAPAGNPTDRFRSRELQSVHPRACGEPEICAAAICPVTGSSPRLRGTRCYRLLLARDARFIPAPAGNPPRRSLHARSGAVHPRACGEPKIQSAIGHPSHGSSPRLRGTHRRPLGVLRRTRFIPAPAGNPDYFTWETGRNTVHPRACGEPSSTACPWWRVDGSSPRLRGTPDLRIGELPGDRFIPAPAGNPEGERWPASHGAVHPRACGEPTMAGRRSPGTNGSSPRLRGTPVRRMRRRIRDRFIPAPAGNPLPRRRGRARGPVHPRACGEPDYIEAVHFAQVGSSPRLRGTHLGSSDRGSGDRFIPAPAGNPAMTSATLS